MALASRSERAELVQLGELHEARFRHTATLLLDGTLLVVGGGVPGSDNEVGFEPLASAELYAPADDSFRVLDAQLATARAAHTATRLLDGSVLIAGGVDAEGMSVRGAELYQPGSGRFAPAGDLITPRALHTATLLGDGRVLLVGGSATLAAGPAIGEAELYDPATGRFEACANSPHASAVANAAALLSDGRVFLLWPGSARAEIFDPTTGTFAPTASLPFSFAQYTGMTRTDDHNLLLFHQGQPGPASVDFGVTVLNSEGQLVSSLGEAAWIPEVPNWEVSMTRAHGVVCSDTQGLCVPSAGSPGNHEVVRKVKTSNRQGHTASTLTDGSVLMVGGINNVDKAFQVLSSTERVDFAQWSVEPVSNPMPASHTATLLSDGKVLLTGGDGTGFADRTALFDGRKLVATAGLKARRSGHVCLPLFDGTALIAGGETQPRAANEEILDWKMGKSHDAGFRLQARGNGVPLANGRFLFAGPKSVEVYDGKAGPPTVPVVLPSPLGCDRPPLVRLANGRVLILGEHVAIEVDPAIPEVPDSSTTALDESRCDSQLEVLADGSVLIVQSAVTGSFARLERYDPQQPDPTARITVLSKSSPIAAGGRLFPWFERPAWLGSRSLSKYDPRSSLFERQNLRFGGGDGNGTISLAVSNVVVLPDASLLSVTTDVTSHWMTSWSRQEATPCCWDFPSHPPRVLMGEERALRAAEGTALFPLTWAEGSSGATNASPSNAPVPVWLPMNGGLAAVGTFLRWSTEGAVWRVPHTAFPGLGLLVLAVNGEHTALGPVEIAPSSSGTSCEQAGECASGRCVNRVCCDPETCAGDETGTGGQAGAGGQPSNCNPEACGDYRCSREQDRCLESCRSNLDCRVGLVCSASQDGTCAEPLPATPPRSACGIGRCAAGTSTFPGVGWLVLLGGVLARHRRRQQRPTSRSGRGYGAAPSAAPVRPLRR